MAFERPKLSERFSNTFLSPFVVRTGRERHIVDELIEERGARIIRHPAWPLMRPFLNLALHYRQAIAMADEIAPLSGEEGLEYVSSLLRLALTTEGTERIPREGPFVLIANHPTGIADGIAVYDAIRDVRRDLAILTNRDALRVNRRFHDVLIPVEWREENKSKAKTRETLLATNRAVEEGRVLVIFPAGRIAYWRKGRLWERPWRKSAVALARRYRLPVLPVHVDARNSGLFYLLAHLSTELRDMTVFHELLNKKGQPFRIHFGPVIEPQRLDGDLNEVTARLQHYCAEMLGRCAGAEFPVSVHDQPRRSCDEA